VTTDRRGRPNVDCQLCGIYGHYASRCHRRFKRDFLGIGNDGRGNEKQAAIAEQSSAGGYHGAGGHTPSYPIDVPWYFDTGATDHMTNEAGRLQAQEPYRGRDKVRTADGSGMPITHVGQASLLSSSSRRLRLRNVLHVPLVTRPLLSVRKFTYDNDVFCEFHPFHLFVKDRATREVLLRGRIHQGLYALEPPSLPEVFSAVRTSASHWHARLGHPASPIVSHVLHRHELPTSSHNKNLAVCDACQQGKSHQLPFVSSSRVVTKPLELVFSDVWGPAQTSVSGHKYYVSFIDAYSRFTWLYLLKSKADVFNVFLQFQLHVERLLQHKIIHVQSDWGGVNIATSILSLISLGYLIVFHVRIHISRTVLSSASTVT
jgi:histone deacetylase 1/2